METKVLRAIKLRHLSAFVETVRCGSLKAAAARINVTQSAISKTIRDLESILGVVLLKRDRGGIELTREGAVFRQFAEQGLASVSNGLASLDALGEGREAPVRIGALPSVAADYLPDVIQRFSALSSVPVVVEDGRVGDLLARLRTNDLDLVLGRMGPAELMLGLSFTQLYTEQVIFAAAPDHALADCTSLERIGASLILYPPPGAAIRMIVDQFLVYSGMVDWPNRLETVSGPFGRAMTLGPARAIWIISEGVVARDIRAGRMVRLPIDTSAMAGTVGVMARSEEDPTPAMRLFRQALFETAHASRDRL